MRLFGKAASKVYHIILITQAVLSVRHYGASCALEVLGPEKINNINYNFYLHCNNLELLLKYWSTVVLGTMHV